MADELNDKRTQRRLERLDANRDLLLHYEPLLLELWGPGSIIGVEWVSREPKPGAGRRLTVNLSYGSWLLDDRAGDSIISLVQHLLPTAHERAALDWAATWLKTHGFANRARARRAAVTFMPPPPDKLLDWSLEAVDPARFWVTAGMPTAHVYRGRWEYRDGDGSLMFYVVRFAHVSDPTKLYRKLAYFGVVHGWRLETVTYRVPPPWPLYNLPELRARPSDPVLVVEGEKTADAAKLLLPQYVVTCWPGGTNAARYADWSPLAERHVTQWPDNDEPGRKAMLRVHNLLSSGNTADLAIVQTQKLPAQLPTGWDLADPLPVGLDPYTVVVSAHDIQDWTIELNREYFVATEGGKSRIFWERQDVDTGQVVLERMTAADFCLLQNNKRVNGFDQRGNPQLVGRGSYWLEHKHRRNYTSIVFAPERDVEAHEYNLWRGYGCGRRAGTPRHALRFIKNVICAGRRAEFLYLLRWLANAVQHPARPGQTAIVMQGLRGIGKGFFANLVGSLVHLQHFKPVVHSEHLVGRFNGFLRQCVVLFADEAFYAGDKKHASVLASLITEPMLNYESKGVDPVMDWNRMHILIASNSEWVIPAALDERRFCVLTVSPAKQRNTDYFEDLRARLEAGEREQLLNFLLSVDLTGWSPLKVPQNVDLSEQKTMNLEPHLAFLLDRLETGEWIEQQSVRALHLAYVEYCERIGVSRRKSTVALGRSLTAALGPAYDAKTRSVANRKERWVTLKEDNVRRALLRHGLATPTPAELELESREEDVPY